MSRLPSSEDVVLGLFQDIHRKEMPEIKANLKKLIFGDGCALDENLKSFLHRHFEEFDVFIGLHGVGAGLNQCQVLGKR